MHLHVHFPIGFHGVVPNYLTTGTILLFFYLTFTPTPTCIAPCPGTDGCHLNKLDTLGAGVSETVPK